MNINHHQKKERRTLRVLYALGLYILFQLVWWGFHLVQLNREIFSLRALKAAGDTQKTVMPKIWMVVGEGSVFFILLAAGFWYMKRTLRRELELASMEQTFLLSVTHELKTPIASIKLILETLQSRQVTAAQSQQMLNQAAQETKRLQQLTENILLATRLDQQSGELIKDEFDLTALVNLEVQRFVSIHHAAIRRELEDHLNIFGDSQMVSSMIVNLIENALKYSPSGSEVFIRLHREGDHAVLRVSDQGSGIPDQIKEKVFEKFYRAGNEQTRTTKGTGLGLYIAKTVAGMHGGTISIDNNQPTGSIFVVRLPMKK